MIFCMMVIVSETKNLTYVKTIFYYFIITLLQIQAMQVLIMLGNECLGLNFYRYGLSVRHPCFIESLCHVIYDTKCAEISALYLFKCSVISAWWWLRRNTSVWSSMLVFCECAELSACVKFALFGHPCLR